MIPVQTAILLLLTLSASDAALPATSKTPLLADGAILSETPGTVHYDEGMDAWRFSIDEPLKAGRITLPAGTTMRLLPSRGLETIIAYAGKAKTARIRLTGMVTRYGEMNFLFPLDAVPMQESPAVPTPEPPPAPRLVTDPNETSVMPQEILERLRVRRRTDFTRMSQAPVLTEDRMLVRRTGTFRLDANHWVFELSGLGLGVPTQRYRLLPNEFRREIERRPLDSFSRPRYTVTAIETVFEGRPYLLLQQIEPAWSYGNFTP